MGALFFGAAMTLLGNGLLGCGQTEGPVDAGSVGPPVQFDAGPPRDAGLSVLDGGQHEREAQCGTYCSKLFLCGYFPLAGIHPPGYSTSDCVQQCSALSGFPRQEQRDCVAAASCACDGGSCHTVDTCFANDGGF